MLPTCPPSQWPSHFSQFGFYDPIMAGSINGTGQIAHDRAILRACEHKLPESPNSNHPPALFVARLSDEDNEISIQRVFEEFVNVKKVDLIRDCVTGQSRRYAFVELYSEKEVERVCRSSRLRFEILSGRPWVIDRPYGRGRLPGWRPRRFGGGLGGTRGSGQMRFGGNACPFRKPTKIDQATIDRVQKLREQYLNEDD